MVQLDRRMTPFHNGAGLVAKSYIDEIIAIGEVSGDNEDVALKTGAKIINKGVKIRANIVTNSGYVNTIEEHRPKPYFVNSDNY